MFREMKMASIKKTLILVLIFVFAGIGILFFKGEDGLTYIKGATDITTKSASKLEDVDFGKIKISKDNLFDMYSEEYRTDGNTKHTVCQYYTIRVGSEASPKLIGVKAYAKHSDVFKQIMDEVDAEQAGETIDNPTTITIKGRMKQMEAEPYGYFKSTMKQAGLTDQQIDGMSMNLMVDEKSLNSACLIYPVLGILCIVIGLISLLYVVTGMGQRKTMKMLKKKGPNAVQIAEEDFENATIVASNLKIGKYYTFVVKGAKNHIIPNDEIIWAYPSKVEHRTNGVHTGTTYAVILKTINKKTYNVTMKNEQIGNDVMEIYNSLTRSIVLGFNTNLKKMFSKSYQEFLNLNYNRFPYGEGIAKPTMNGPEQQMNEQQNFNEQQNQNTYSDNNMMQ